MSTDEKMDLAALRAEAEELMEERRTRGNIKAVADLQAEIEAVDRERRERRDVLDKSRKRQEKILDALSLTQEQAEGLVQSGELPAEARDMLRRKLDEARRADSPKEAEGEGESSAKKTKKRTIMKI